MVGLDAEVEDDDGTRTWLISKAAVSEGELSCRTARNGICGVLVWFRTAELKDSCDDRVEEDDGGGDNCPAERKSRREEELEDGAY